MTLFSLHHHSNFLRLLPPALWRDPGHCAGGRRGETERIAHPGKSELLCGVRVLHMHTHTQHKHSPCLSPCTSKDQFEMWQMAYRDPFLGLVCSVFGSRSPPSHVDRWDPPYSSPHNGWRRTGLGKVSFDSTLLSSCLCLSIIDELPIKAAHFGCHFSRLEQGGFRWGEKASFIKLCFWYGHFSSSTPW